MLLLEEYEEETTVSVSVCVNIVRLCLKNVTAAVPVNVLTCGFSVSRCFCIEDKCGKEENG